MKKIRKVKNFTLDLNNICSRDIINKQDKMCTVGQYLYRCGYSKKELRELNGKSDYFGRFYKLTGLDASDIYSINDDVKSSWNRRIQKMIKLFSNVKINLKVKK